MSGHPFGDFAETIGGCMTCGAKPCVCAYPPINYQVDAIDAGGDPLNVPGDKITSDQAQAIEAWQTDREQTRRARMEFPARELTDFEKYLLTELEQAGRDVAALSESVARIEVELEQAEAETRRLRDRGLQRQTWSIRL